MKRRINKNGFTLVEILTVILILGLLAAIAIPAINRYIRLSEEKYYKSLEEELVIIGRDYYVKNKDELPRGQLNSEGIPLYINQVDLITLKEKGYVTNDIVSTKKEPCSGYVRVENKGNNEYEYIGCIKCGNKYTSEANNTYCTLYENFDDLKKANGALLCNIDTGSYINNTWTNQDINATITSIYENGTSAQIGMYKNINTGITLKAVNNSAKIKVTESGSLKIYTYDKLGNRGECSLDNIKIDKENPSVSFASSNITTSNSGVKVTATLKDNNGVIAYQVNQSSNSPSDGWTTINETKETTITTDYLTTTKSTTYYIWAKDVAGNVNKKRIIVGLSGWSEWTDNGHGLCPTGTLYEQRTMYSTKSVTSYCAKWSDSYSPNACSGNDGVNCREVSGYANYVVQYPTYNTTNRLMKEGGIVGATPGVSEEYCYQFRLETKATFTKYGCSQSVGYTTPSYDASAQKCHCKYGGGTLDDALVRINTSVKNVAPGVDGDYCYQPNSKITQYYDKYSCSDGTIQYQSGKCKCPYCSIGTLYDSDDYKQDMCRTNTFSHYSTSSYGYWGVSATLHNKCETYGTTSGNWSEYTDTNGTGKGCVNWDDENTCKWRYDCRTRSYTYSLD